MFLSFLFDFGLIHSFKANLEHIIKRNSPSLNNLGRGIQFADDMRVPVIIQVECLVSLVRCADPFVMSRNEEFYRRKNTSRNFLVYLFWGFLSCQRLNHFHFSFDLFRTKLTSTLQQNEHRRSFSFTFHIKRNQ